MTSSFALVLEFDFKTAGCKDFSFDFKIWLKSWYLILDL